MGCCPDCSSGDIELVKQTDDGNQKWFQTEEYSCNECGCEWEWEIKLNILEHGTIE